FHSCSSFAQGGGSSTFEATMGAGYLGISRSASQFDIAPGLQFVPFSSLSWLQIGAEATYQNISFRGGSTSNVMILAGITANVGPVMNDAFFISLGPAFRSGLTDAVDDATPDPSGTGFYFFTGKRFTISGGFTLRPTIGVVSCGTTGMVFRPFAVSLLF
ncbi:MAG: hypothetical protein H7333_12625, partial [Bdellovibrionales bacterium]|nr:hypothetical protein [Oligoflexia bacterium]